jgi:hypothetical protein
MISNLLSLLKALCHSKSQRSDIEILQGRRSVLNFFWGGQGLKRSHGDQGYRSGARAVRLGTCPRKNDNFEVISSGFFSQQIIPVSTDGSVVQPCFLFLFLSRLILPIDLKSSAFERDLNSTQNGYILAGLFSEGRLRDCHHRLLSIESSFFSYL